MSAKLSNQPKVGDPAPGRALVVALRVASFLMNVFALGVLPWLLGGPIWVGAIVLPMGLAGSWLFAHRMPEGEVADPITVSVARRLAERMGLPHPVVVRSHPGWLAGACRVRGGYGLVVGDEIDPAHREAVLAHELAHVATGDLLWEPWTDGTARALLPVVRACPPVFLIVFPFFLFGAPLARFTELRADDFASRLISSYPSVMKEVAAILGVRSTLLYPSLEARARRSARRSMRIQR